MHFLLITCAKFIRFIFSLIYLIMSVVLTLHRFIFMSLKRGGGAEGKNFET